MYILELFEKRKKEAAVARLNSDNFRAGDTVAAHIQSEEKSSKPFVGVCIRKSASTALLREVIGNEAVEFIFPLYSNVKFELLRSAKVRRARLYYLRDLKGKKARLKERYKRS
ncbi:50S ribosomal protein L19 [Candidatus Cytomitobacter primus]|uniref:Large ribosomal subunit protein bL19 n=1 Tax=Candidatus Cytomitobacter primus TaxID=2066024 RepID=A0A5C0UF64_9PROT|nr:50S ribosomal protein L19 [Candidatus Cytomitobacter primus]QEK38746.1 50S ribosomal protein L19 [Candidatus Cytomitobacter primus]